MVTFQQRLRKWVVRPTILIVEGTFLLLLLSLALRAILS
jgi:hypothetical protein